ncbi:MAG: hypothetical protein RQ936_04820 [Gammaproteobacteria bacterium]|nr:hypothetical protein [Gammaproteobacteria bacterium]
MLTEELKVFESRHEGIVLFNEDGTFDYTNEAGANWLWGFGDDDALYRKLETVIGSMVSHSKYHALMFKLKNVPGVGEISCAIFRVNCHILAVLDKRLDNKSPGMGIVSPLAEIRQTLQLMSTVYVGGRAVQHSYRR